MAQIVITTCTNRKRIEPALELCARSMPHGDAREVASLWRERLDRSVNRVALTSLYCGRGWQEATAAAEVSHSRLFVVSAGLGLISAAGEAPAYNLTLVSGSPDDITRKLNRGSSAEWWDFISEGLSPAAEALGDRGLILAALSRPYLSMVGRDWSRWPQPLKDRLRLFTLDPSGVPEGLGQNWMPYDERLESLGSGHAGTRSDFAQRALRHFATHFASAPGDAQQHAELVRRALAPFALPVVPDRERLTDREIVGLIHREWDAVGGRSGAMLTHLRRGLEVACEQGRFRLLFARASQERQGALL